MAKELELGGMAPVQAASGARRSPRSTQEYGRVAAGADGVAPCVSCGTTARGCSWSTTTKVNRLLLDPQPRNCKVTALRSAENGRVALEMLRRDGIRPRCCSTWKCPEMDGFQVLEQLKNDLAAARPAGHRHLVAGRDRPRRALHRARRGGLSPKPVNPVLLKARIGASLEKKRLRDQQKELVRRFATPEVAQDLQESGFSLGGKRVRGSVMFSDIRGFTALVESQPPEETIDLLNTYYTLMFDAISGHGGIVSLIVGDGLMAIFGAPLPLARPLRGRGARSAGDDRIGGAVQRTSGSSPTNLRSESASASRLAKWWPATRARRQRATYTCIGNTVNLAARLETHTKLATRAILIDSDTRDGPERAHRGGTLGPVTFKGIANPVDVFSVGLGQKL